jgi:hypothetical protein
MDLIRLDSNPNPKPDQFPDEHRQTEELTEDLIEHIAPWDRDDSKLRVNFKRFGRGELRKPSFAVEINWKDVRRFVREFIEMGHREADYLRRMLEVARAIERAGWQPDDPPFDDFWDIMAPNSN